jgi:hypothetical protein
MENLLDPERLFYALPAPTGVPPSAAFDAYFPMLPLAVQAFMRTGSTMVRTINKMLLNAFIVILQLD